MPQLRRLDIHLERPNPDDLTDEANRILEKLVRQGAKSQDLALTKAPGVSNLTPDEDTKTLAEIAATNGYVSGRGRDEEGNITTVSTSEHPKRIPVIVEQEQSALIRFLSTLRRL